MAVPQDLFTFNPLGKKVQKEQVTTHKLSLLVLVYEYQQQKKPPDPLDPPIFSETEKRDFMTTLLDLLQSLHLELVVLKQRLEPILKPCLYEGFIARLKEFSEEGVQPLMDFFELVNNLVFPEPPDDPQIVKSSVFGLFIRRMVLAFNKLSFSQVTYFHSKVKAYYSVLVEAESELAKSMTESVMSLSGMEPLTKSGLGKSFDGLHLPSETVPGGFYSQKQAEYFIAQQAFMLLHNEQAALPPGKLQEKITALLRDMPDMAEAYFLSYLNSLRVKEYCTALHNLYNYFNRSANMAEESATPGKGQDEDVSRRYAALNLAVLLYRFGHKTEAMEALQESIRMAQKKNDHVCLQHALCWLHRLGDNNVAHTKNLMERSVSKSAELSLPYLTSLGVQALAKHNAITTAKPSSVFEYLVKSDILNCQHSLVGLMCISYAQKAALWSMYGKRECSSMCSQLVLNLDTSESMVYYNGESVCIALCNLALHHKDEGNYTTALDLVGNARHRFPAKSQYAHIWMCCEQVILFDRNLYNKKWSQAEQAVLNLRALNEDEANLRHGILLRETGEVTEASSELHSILKKESSRKKKEVSPDYECSVLLALVEVYTQTGNPATALPHVMDCITRAKEHHLHYLLAMATIYLAFIQFDMRLYEQALGLIEQHLLTVLTHGSCLDKARTLYLYSKCCVAAASKASPADRRSALASAVSVMNQVIDLFKKIEANHRVKDALYYQARLFNDLGYTAERNKCAYQFKQLDLLSATESPMEVTMF
ncbi:anaphase-promoting complex subunit 5-like [Gigantopelta aegis]|uniref:anaphase-promoting complex subunit 5-like n=1 Tax=Gigantopelta aegis TaxID=1735272 RepID=UPI001B88B2D8|nr:anaphase-promoting complex subunit 5-like [Gigantopelta aegis]